MGIVFGVTGVKEPPFTLIQAVPFEVRYYEPYFVAEVFMREGHDKEAFPILAKYIGVFGEPQNTRKTPMAMTAPVLTEPAKTSESISMTAPVLLSEEKMGFVLPFEYKSLGEIPTPTDERVKLREIPAQTVAVSKFSGWFSNIVASNHLTELSNKLKKADLISKDASSESLNWCVAQYHPPFTIPFLRRNEVWVKIDRTKLSQLADKADGITGSASGTG